MNTFSWYNNLKKPSWAPPSWLFGPAWSVLYVLIGISFFVVFSKLFSGELPWIVALPFALNLFFNFAFSPIQFGLKNNILAAVDILLLLITLIWALISIYAYFPWITFINIPYLAWVSFATVLQLTVTYLNRKK